MLLKASKILLNVALLSCVVVLTSAFFPFIGGKDYFFRFAVELALACFILWWAFEARDHEVIHRLKEVSKKPIFIAVSIFVVAFLLASAFAYDPHAAFWSNFERGEGGFEMIHYYVFFALLATLFEKKEDWRLFFKAGLIAASLMILYGVFAQLGWADNFISPYSGGPPPGGWFTRLVDARFQGSLGNPAYVAPYLLFSMFYAFSLWATSKLNNKWVKRILYGGVTISFLAFFFFSQTRGAFAGLAAAVAVFFLYFIFLKPKLRRWLIPVFAILAVAFVVMVHYRDTDFVKNLPGGRLFDLSLTADSAKTRLWTWGSAWQGFEARPLLGWGPENFSAVFDKYFNPGHFVPGQNTETWFDRAHSIYFDYLAETGILGFLSYLGIFAAFYWEFFKRAYRRHDFSQLEKALIFVMPVAYLVQGIAIFDVLPIHINVFAFLAFSYFVFYHHGTASASDEHKLSTSSHHAAN